MYAVNGHPGWGAPEDFAQLLHRDDGNWWANESKSADHRGSGIRRLPPGPGTAGSGPRRDRAGRGGAQPRRGATAELSHPRFRYLWKSVQDIQPADVEGHSVVAHLAAQPDTPLAFGSPRYTAMQNINGTVELLEAVRRAGGVSKVIYAGSGNEVGRARYLPLDEDHPLTPYNPYGWSKAAGELAMWAWQRAYGVPSIVLSTAAWWWARA